MDEKISARQAVIEATMNDVRTIEADLGVRDRDVLADADGEVLVVDSPAGDGEVVTVGPLQHTFATGLQIKCHIGRMQMQGLNKVSTHN